MGLLAVRAELYNSTSADDLAGVNNTMCATPTATLVASFTVSADQRTTERLMVTTSVLMTVFGIALFLVGLFGRLTGRQKAHSILTRTFFRASFALFLPFMSYMFSQAKIRRVEARAQLILLWMLISELLRRKVYTMVVPARDALARGVDRFTFFDNVEQAARMAWIGYLIYAYVHGFGIKSFFIILWLFSVVKLIKHMLCIEFAKHSFDVGKNGRLLSGYMAQLVGYEKQYQVHDATEHIMSKCNYAVMGEGKLKRKKTPEGYRLLHLDDILSGKTVEEAAKDAKKKAAEEGKDEKEAAEAGEEAKAAVEASKELVRVSTIWEFAKTDRLFRYDKQRKQKLEDICLGLALFKLIRRRFEEHCPVAEAGTDQARELVVRGLLSLNGNNDVSDAERAFKVAEVELNFLDEYRQATIPIELPKPWLFFVNFFSSIVFILAYCVAVLLITGNGNMFHVLGSLFRGAAGLPVNMVVMFKCFRHQVSFLVGMVFSSSDLIVTFLLIFTLLAVELHDLVLYLFSDWFAASLLCAYARQPGLREGWAVRHIVLLIMRFKVWSHNEIKVHQQSMLRLHRRRIWMRVSHLLKRRLIGRHRATINTEAKVAIVRAIKDRSAAGKFTNVAESLTCSGYSRLAWACDDSLSTTEVILVWHLATSLFKARHPSGKRQLPPDGRAAVTLSKYCTYLVAYEPKLLPDDPTWTKEAYNGMKKELYIFFRGCGSAVCRRERLLQLHMEKNTPMTKGARLGWHLEEGVTTMEEEEKVWKVLAKFWAELLVSVAPSGCAQAHGLALAHGGEFITCVWSMLMHAGIGDDRTSTTSFHMTHLP